MIKLPTKKELEQLQAFKEPFCLTIYAPCIDPNTSENPVRIEMKNILREAKVALLSAGVGEKDTKKTLTPIREHMEEFEVRAIRQEGLVFFSHPKFFNYYHIPDEVTPYAITVETGFNVDHLLKIIQSNQQYYILAISHKNVRFYEGDHYHIEPVQLKNFPSDMKEALNIDEYSKSRQTHSIAPASEGKGSEAFHQQYNVRETDKILLEQFFRKIDKRLHHYLLKNGYPLILAGVKYLAPIYSKVNTYPYLLPEIIAGNQERADLRSMREKAWSLLQRSVDLLSGAEDMSY